MSFWEKNEQQLKIRDEGLYNKYQQMQKENSASVGFAELNTGEKVICYLQQNREWRLNSIYNPTQAAEIYAERYGQFKDYSVICVFGLSDGTVLEALLKRCNGTQQIIVYEPEWEIFVMAMQEFDLTKFFALDNLHFIVKGMNEETLQPTMESLINYQNRNLLVQCILPNYDILFPEECNFYAETMIYYSKMSVFMRNTEIEFGKKMMVNIFCNINRILKESSVTNLQQAFRKLDLEHIPAIIVSAGPSLDKNIEELKKVRGKAFIISVDSAMKALLRHDIQPDLAVTVDFNKNPDVFQDDRMFEIPWVVSVSSLPLLVESNKNRLFFENVAGFEAYYDLIKRSTGKDLGQLETGGSVATDTLSLAISMGFKKIVLIGQDLAFTGGKGHVSGFEKSEQADKEHVKSRKIVEVEAQDGGMIETDIQMESYLRWFEMRIEREKDKIEFYNATEGGARIRGTIQMPLREVIAKLCEEEVDFRKILREIPDTFTEEERLLLKKEILDADKYLENLRRELQKGIEAYDSLIRLERVQKQATQEYVKAVKAVTKVNQIEENERYIEMIKLYAKALEADVADDIYEAESLSVIEIAERGKTLLEGYVKGIGLCREVMEVHLFPTLS